MSEPFDVPFGSGAPLEARMYRASAADAPALILAHGAGAGQQSRFMTAFAEALAARGVTVTTFDFPYIRQRRRVPDRNDVLEAAWRAVLAHCGSLGLAAPGRMFVGGKSMGGRIASQVIADAEVLRKPVGGLVLLGYPLHPPGRPAQLRTAHLPSLATPVLVVQGERDAFGTPTEIREAFAVCQAPVEVFTVPGADHSFKVPRGGQPQGVIDDGIRDHVTSWIGRLTGR